jgi:hypothetical protein
MEFAAKMCQIFLHFIIEAHCILTIEFRANDICSNVVINAQLYIESD